MKVYVLIVLFLLVGVVVLLWYELPTTSFTIKYKTERRNEQLLNHLNNLEAQIAHYQQHGIPEEVECNMDALADAIRRSDISVDDIGEGVRRLEKFKSYE